MHIHTYRNRISPEGKAVSPPLLSSSNIKCTFVIPKTSGLGLGIIIGGGMSRVDGPYITIDKILEGMDAAKVNSNWDYEYVLMTTHWAI